MRIRRKKRVSERVEAVKDYLIVSDMDIANVKYAIKQTKYLNYFNLFNNNNPVQLEIGCGKGKFIIEKAKQNPNINFIAVELLENIIVMAAESAKTEKLNNLKFFNCGADYLPRYIKKNSIEKIFLNFSPPFAGKRYENRRLTKPELVNNYRDYLIDNGVVEQKTDDKDFIEYSKNVFAKYDFTVCDVSNDKEFLSRNILTEYEIKFQQLNMKIYAIIAKKQ